MEGLGTVVLLLAVIAVCIMVAVSRWIFRINTIIDRLDKIVYLLEGKPGKPKTFMEGIKRGMAE